MKVPAEIKTLIREIESTQYYLKDAYKILYDWLSVNHINVTDDTHKDMDIIANLQDGVGGEEFIKWLEHYKNKN